MVKTKTPWVIGIAAFAVLVLILLFSFFGLFQESLFQLKSPDIEQVIAPDSNRPASYTFGAQKFRDDVVSSTATLPNGITIETSVRREINILKGCSAIQNPLDRYSSMCVWEQDGSSCRNLLVGNAVAFELMATKDSVDASGCPVRTYTIRNGRNRFSALIRG